MEVTITNGLHMKCKISLVLFLQSASHFVRKYSPLIVDMSLNEQTGYLNIDNAHLRVEGNIVAENIELGNIQIGPTYGLSSVTDVGNTTSQTVQFTNAATGLVTTGNVAVGKELTVTGNVTMSEELTVTGNVVMTGTGALTLPSGTTAQQPTGVEGMVRFNTTTNRMEFYSGTEWRSLGSVSATGGTVTTIGGYRIHTFTQDGDFVVESGGPVEYLIVAGGGGGGQNVAGGGGGGGYRSSVFGVGSGGGRDQYETPMSVVSGTTYPVVVGQGGEGSTSGSLNGTNGGDSSFNSIVAVGGGGGGRGDHNGNSGGSGGGGGARSASGNSVGGAGTTEQGFAGGAGRGGAGYYPAGGGGGAGEIGQSYVSSSQAGRGGNGLLSTIDGIPTYRGGGGGGAVLSNGTAGEGGLGGGGSGERHSAGPTAEDGVANTGGGGGGGHGNGGNGGSGVVIIRYKYI
jgi:hypothetical protein